MDSEFPFPYHYPMNLTVLQGTSAIQQISVGSPGNPAQQGTNPVILKLGNEGAFQWMFRLIHASSPDVAGDASRFLQIALNDLSGTNWPFQNAPIFADLFAGDAKLPWPELNPLTFGQNTQLTLQGYPVNYTGLAQGIGVGTGAAAAFTGTLAGPVLRGSVYLTDAGVVVGTDDGNGNIVVSGTSVGTVNYLTGAVSINYDSVLGDIVSISYSQGCARIDAQFDMQGAYLRPYTDGEKTQMAGG